MLDILTSDDFKPRLNDAFDVSCDGISVTLTLTAIDVLDARRSHPGERPSFSLIFSGSFEPLLLAGSCDPYLPKNTYRFRNKTLGDLEMFSVPIGAKDGRLRYEVVFT